MQQMKTPFPNEHETATLRQKYPHGAMLRLIHIFDDPNPIEPETVGSVDYIDDAGNIHMIWRSGRTLSLIDGVDEFEVLPTCRKCGKQYTERPAMSRIDSSTICSMCGYKEAAAFLPDSLQKEILRTIRTAEKNAD